MTEKIVSPVAPDVLDPTPHHAVSGDWTDDDAMVIDETLEAANVGPQEYAGEPYDVMELPTPSRILARTVVVGTVNGTVADPVQVFPIDLDRRNFTIQCSGTVGVVVASQKTDLYGLASAMDARFPITITDHTGAIWVYSTDSNAVTVTVWCVTE